MTSLQRIRDVEYSAEVEECDELSQANMPFAPVSFSCDEEEKGGLILG